MFMSPVSMHPSAPVMGGGPPSSAIEARHRIDEPDVATIAARCRRAAEAVVLCASASLSGAVSAGAELSEWCIAAARTLGACADLLDVTSDPSRAVLGVAIARAGLIAAEGCLGACERHDDDLCRDAVTACRHAADGLRSLVVRFDERAEGTPRPERTSPRGRLGGVTIRVVPATVFEDVSTMLGPKRPDANVCWCLTYRLPSKDDRALVGPARGERMRDWVDEAVPPGVLAYDGEDVVGWAAVHPRSATNFARNRKIPHVDDLDVWSIWCLRVRPGHRGQGVAHHLLSGAVDFAREHGAPAVEGYPVDNDGAKVNPTMAYVGTKRLFEEAGFVEAADTTSVIDGFARVVMRRSLTA